MAKVIKITIEDAPICEFKDAKDLADYISTHPEEENQLDWSEAVKGFKKFHKNPKK